MRFAQWTFRVAGGLGLLMLLPFYFLEERIGQDAPPAITHPEYFYGFLGVGVAWQVAFLIIGQDPVRYRPLMVPGMLEKFGFVGAVVVLYLKGRVPVELLAVSSFDLTLGALFVIAFIRLARAAEQGHQSA
jgi:hypothetical protein